MKYKNKAVMAFACLLFFLSCTKLDETLYDRITSENFLQTKDDVIRTFLRPFEHGYWTIQGNGLFYAQELPGDQLMTPNRDGDWFDGGKYQRLHYHKWTIQDDYTSNMWNGLFQGVSLATNSLEDIQAIDPAKFGLTQKDKDGFIAELRTLRAWMNLRAFDLYRNIPIITRVKGESLTPDQAPPAETFNFIEKELLEAIPNLPTRQELGVNAVGRWTKAAAAAILVRLYLNAKVYTDQDKFTQCEAVCRDILSGKYGTYALENRWDAPYDYNNAQSGEVIFGFPGSFAQTHWQYSGDMYFWMAPHQASNFFGFTDFGNMNTRFSMQPGRDVDSVEYAFTLGKPFVKFQKYTDDVRLVKYKNLGNSKREGMFLHGYLPYYKDPKQLVKSNRGYTIFARDMVGWFKATPPGQKIADKVSNMDHADDNSGIWPAKYPIYPSDDANKITSSYAEIRLAEIYYSLAECVYRKGNKVEAASLLNSVRKRYYPAGSPSLYSASGSELTDREMIDEWGREFLAEGRRRTDLIRWNVFNTGIWWDKEADADDHTKIYPIGQNVLNISPNLKQNPGYN
ncbi:RagB/SusD family nutrient uptake outer membrane protein [Hufsiella ginkgonis]|uniref:RagB/SusD family nutrient uptake outer membrane protein n=1 Tax=Hufsiella ginkgonis TaxID=2695274 RepID=A0A7K1XXU5_9SPHI|nr:RagB/SusD family nutrient uptake outer membrane protein [Hufsiella ginkgonis]MXV15772.1 RagB/SusD family nutrient uptake outer membrane protein [Hufsiella ginkgonis]